MCSEGGLCLEFLKVYCKFTYTCSHFTHSKSITCSQRQLKDHYIYEGICEHVLLLWVLSCTKTVLYSGELEEYS